jgi:hypothetical protein
MSAAGKAKGKEEILAIRGTAARRRAIARARHYEAQIAKRVAEAV